jgi:hypothetical protein
LAFEEVVKLEEKKSQLKQLILKENISAIVVISEKLSIDPETAIAMIDELITEGQMIGSFSEDKSRFFKSAVTVSKAPVIPREEKPPEFMSYNSKPGKVMASIGFLILAGGVIINAFATDIQEQTFASILILIGLLVFLIGLYSIARRGAPD